MAIEIERKFLVKSNAFKAKAAKIIHIKQAYLSSVPERTVRLRILEKKAFITIKGIRSESAVSRYEWEKEIPLKEAKELLEICEPGLIEKNRFYIKSGKHTFEVDEFYGENEGLIVAEVELASEDEEFLKPEWLAEEVSMDMKYYNSMLIKNPYGRWK